jgi:hypothetical protein
MRAFGGFISRPGVDVAGESAPMGRRFLAATAVASLAVLLAACGGGGGGGSTATAQGGSGGDLQTGNSGNGGNGGNTGNTGASQPALPSASAPGAFYFQADASVATPAALAQQTGGTTFASWNPVDAYNTNRPGMKVTFFGAATGCVAGHTGVVGAGDADRFAASATSTGVPVAADPSLRWTPQGDTAGCAPSAQSASGDSLVTLDAQAVDGKMGVLTFTGPRNDGGDAFFGPYGSAGQNGAGGNAGIAATFVAFRQDWQGTSPREPFASTGTARIHSVQSVAATGGATGALGNSAVQAKQEILLTLVNPTCVTEAAGTNRPCKVQYDLSTNIVRTDTSDWNTVGWFNAGKVWFDAVQGGTPIIDGPIKASSVATNDVSTSLPLYSSMGAATQHGAFSNQAFDVRITFPQLVNALRITVAKQLSIDASAVTDAQMAAFWGSRWNDASAWATMSASVGQEVYNPFSSTRQAFIGGSFQSLYVGPDA